MSERAPGVRVTRSRRARVIVTALGLIALGGLLWLGTWQVHRRTWKLHLIHAVAERLHKAPVPAPGPGQWRAITFDRDAYRRISVTGRFLYDRGASVQAVTEDGAGYWLLTPLATNRGFTVLVNRGFVAPGWRESRPAPGPVTVVGLLRISEPGGAFLRRNYPAADRWYSRDVAAIGAARRLGLLAPYFIDADAGSNGPGQPHAGLTVVHFPNNHLVYLLTWYGLALLLVIWLILLWRAPSTEGGATRLND